MRFQEHLDYLKICPLNAGINCFDPAGVSTAFFPNLFAIQTRKERQEIKKRTIKRTLEEAGPISKSNHSAFVKTLPDAGVLDESIFFAEPKEVPTSGEKVCLT